MTSSNESFQGSESSRITNLREIEGFKHELEGMEVPSFVELPATAFHAITPPSQDMLDSLSQVSFDKPDEELVQYYLDELRDKDLLRWIDSSFSPLLSEGPIIIRCAPVVPETADNLSFAGTYPSFIPKPLPEQPPNSVHRSVASVLAGKHTRYASYYLETHDVQGCDLGVMGMELISDPAIHGTAYSMGHNVRSEHILDPSLDGEQYALQSGAIDIADDKFGFTTNAEGESFAEEIGYTKRLVGLCRALEDKFGFPIDMEYLVDQSGTFHVVQVREMSARHAENWGNYYNQRPSEVDATGRTARRAIIGSVGTTSGEVKEFKAAKPVKPGELVVLEHANVSDLLETQPLKQSAFPVVDVHSANRTRDHLQYASFEDRRIQSLIHLERDEIELGEGEEVTLASNGDSARKVTKLRRRAIDAS